MYVKKEIPPKVWQPVSIVLETKEDAALIAKVIRAYCNPYVEKPTKEWELLRIIQQDLGL